MLKGGKTRIEITKNFNVKIYVIGYKNQGESIVILFLDNTTNKNTVKYSIVIDCFEYKKKNLTDEILREYSVETLSMLCWTHPDIDHSRGIDHLIKKYCKTSTKILMPEHFYGINNDIVIFKDKKEREAINRIFELDRLKNNSVTNISVAANGYNEIDSLTFSTFVKDFDVSINAVTPVSSILSKYIRENNHNINKNELSISLIINIDDYNFFFGGDTLNNHICAIKRPFIKDCRFIKIPHHSSDSSDFLIQSIDDSIDIACTTIFSPKKLPLDHILKGYHGKGDVFSTGHKSKKKYDYGVIEYSYHFLPNDMNIEIKLHGNACKIEI